MKTITAKTTAYLTEYSELGPDDLRTDPEGFVQGASFSKHDMAKAGWTRIGEATVTIEIIDEDELIAAKVDALRGELNSVTAKAYMEAARIESKINKLLALTNCVEAA